MIAALQGQAEANGGALLYSRNASVENLAHFMKSKFVLNERELIVRDIDLTEATIIPRNSEVDYYVSYKDMLDDIISPLAFEKRRLLNLTPGERFMRRCKPGIMITLSGARKAEMGFEPRPTAHGYPERAYELIAQTVAEILSKGYPGMPVTKEERANAKAFNRISARPLRYYLREYKGGAIPWEKVRAIAEEQSGYTIRDSDIKYIAPRLSKYGVEAMATIQKRETDDRYQVDRIAFVRPSAHLGRDVMQSFKLDGKDGLSDADSRSIWKKFPTHELPEVAFITVNQDVWKLSCETSLLAPRGGLQKLILEWYHPSDPRGRHICERRYHTSNIGDTGMRCAQRITPRITKAIP